MDHNVTEIMRKNEHLFEITRDGLLGQDFVSKDGRISVKHLRKGGGFTMGRNYYRIVVDNREEVMENLEEVYSKIIKVLKLT